MSKRSVKLVVMTAAILATLAVPVSAYVAPVRAPIVDFFRAPDQPYGPGNRGIDYATETGTPVRASASGVVTFAGAVGAVLFVVIAHDDGLRTTYGHLQSLTVVVGQRVETGDVVGEARDRLHFGIRRGDTYLDPLSVLGRGRAHLVPVRSAN